MSPLRYRCATGPRRFYIKLSFCFGLRVSVETAFPALPTSRKILNGSDFSRQSATGPRRFYIKLSFCFGLRVSVETAFPESRYYQKDSGLLLLTGHHKHPAIVYIKSYQLHTKKSSHQKINTSTSINYYF